MAAKAAAKLAAEQQAAAESLRSLLPYMAGPSPGAGGAAASGEASGGASGTAAGGGLAGAAGAPGGGNGGAPGPAGGGHERAMGHQTFPQAGEAGAVAPGELDARTLASVALGTMMKSVPPVDSNQTHADWKVGQDPAAIAAATALQFKARALDSRLVDRKSSEEKHMASLCEFLEECGG